MGLKQKRDKLFLVIPQNMERKEVKDDVLTEIILKISNFMAVKVNIIMIIWDKNRGKIKVKNYV